MKTYIGIVVLALVSGFVLSILPAQQEPSFECPRAPSKQGKVERLT